MFSPKRSALFPVVTALGMSLANPAVAALSGATPEGLFVTAVVNWTDASNNAQSLTWQMGDARFNDATMTDGTAGYTATAGAVAYPGVSTTNPEFAVTLGTDTNNDGSVTSADQALVFNPDPSIAQSSQLSILA
jgi:hypothetical protein